MASAGVRTNGYVILPPCPQKCPASPNSALSCFGAISGGIRDGCSRALIRVCSRLPDADSDTESECNEAVPSDLSEDRSTFSAERSWGNEDLTVEEVEGTHPVEALVDVRAAQHH
ncbi:hypothetical protein CLOM_g18868 [Closterium sp. NIES-68]|nr:hypothetical protein CLOM_g18868 [Closterium sp. NIES-68]GJP76767.1 hypothetical protein CLOP_g7229 [Closterium sp. NIES-67]